MTLKCDVLVVGAGPAGSMAAKTAAEGGVDVLVIEEHEKIGIPVQCAEGVNKFLFQDTGIEENEVFINQRSTGTKIYFYDEVYELNTEQWKCYTINRKIFDKYLADKAASAGAKVVTSAKAIGMAKRGSKNIVKVESKGELQSIESKIVVGAGGFGCKVGQWAGIRKPWNLDEFVKCLDYELKISNLKEPDKFHLFFCEEFPNGYGWIFPKGKNLANVGVGVNPKSSAKEALEFLMNEYPSAKNILGKHHSVKEVRAGGVPVTGPLTFDEIVSDGVILVGDAAGIVDPITGEGITSSMISGIAAGETLREVLNHGDWSKKRLYGYIEKWRNKQYGGKPRLGEELDLLTRIKDLFFRAFTKKEIPREIRADFIRAIISDNVTEKCRIISNIQDILT